MSDPFVGEIRYVGFTWVPAGWLACDGDLLPVSNPYLPLFSIIGATYGGDGRKNFAVPDLRGRAAMGCGSGSGLTTRPIGGSGGVTDVTLDMMTTPSHTHNMISSQLTATEKTPAENSFIAVAPSSKVATTKVYSPTVTAQMHPKSVSAYGGGIVSSHYNVQPYQAVFAIINYDGWYPQRSDL